MGKVSRKKTHSKQIKAAADPLGGRESTPAASVSGWKEDGGVVNGLNSLELTVRESSCAAIAGVFATVEYGHGNSSNDANWAVVKKLLNGGVIKKLLHRLVDAAPSVRVHAAGALHNISDTGDPKICEGMVRDDTLTPLLKLLGDMAGSNTAPRTGEQEEVVMLQMLSCMTNLFESVEAAVVRFTKQGGLQVLLAVLSARGSKGSEEVFSAAVQALHVVTDANPDVVEQLAAASGAADKLASIVAGDVFHDVIDGQPLSVTPSLVTRLQAAGVLTNMAGYMAEARGWGGFEGGNRFAQLVVPLLLQSMTYEGGQLGQLLLDLKLQLKKHSSSPSQQQHGGDEGPESAMADDDDVGGDGSGGGGSAAGGGGGGKAGAQAAAQPIGEGGDAMEDDGDDDGDGDDEGGGAFMDDEAGMKTKQRLELDGCDAEAHVRWQWKRSVSTPLKLAAEVLTDLCSLGIEERGAEDAEEEWDIDNVQAVEDYVMSGVGNGGSGGGGGGVSAEQTSLTAVIHKAIIDSGGLSRVLTTLKNLLASLGGEMMTSLPAGVYRDISELRVTVSLCAANLVQNLPAGGLGNVLELWSNVCALQRQSFVLVTEEGGVKAQASGGVVVGGGDTCESSVAEDGTGDVAADGGGGGGSSGGGGAGVKGKGKGKGKGKKSGATKQLDKVSGAAAGGGGAAAAAGGGAAAAAVAAGGAPVSAQSAVVAAVSGIVWGLARRAGAPIQRAGLGLGVPAGGGGGATGGGEMALFLQLCDPLLSSSEARVNGVATLSALGTACPHNLQCNQALATLLLAALDDADLLVQNEALNAIMDIYGSDDNAAVCDSVFQQLGMLAKLRQVSADFKRNVKSNGAQYGRDALSHMKETSLNTIRFIKYKA